MIPLLYKSKYETLEFWKNANIEISQHIKVEIEQEC